MPHNKTIHAAQVAGKSGFSLISDDKFRDLHAALLKCSILDSELRSRARYAQTYKPWIGCQAVSAGVVACLREGDSITSTTHSLLAEWLHHGNSALQPEARSVDASSHLAAATGEGLRHKLEQSAGVAVAFTGVAQPQFMRTVFTAAAQQSLPVVYVLAGGNPPPECCAGIPVISVDATDTVAIYRVAYESIFRARNGGGPTVIECVPWPQMSHEEPLAKLEAYLAAKQLFRRDWKLRLEKKHSNLIGKAVADSVQS